MTSAMPISWYDLHDALPELFPDGLNTDDMTQSEIMKQFADHNDFATYEDAEIFIMMLDKVLQKIEIAETMFGGQKVVALPDSTNPFGAAWSKVVG